MEGGTTQTVKSSAEEIIKRANEQRFHTLSEMRLFLKKRIATWDLLEAAPKTEIPGRIFAHRKGNREQPQGSLALHLEDTIAPIDTRSNNQLVLASWVPEASRRWFNIIFARLQKLEQEDTAVITKEGEEVIRELVRLELAGTEESAITVKYAASTALLRHFSDSAKDLREYKSFREFDSFQELEDFLRLRCPFLYCLGTIFLHSHRILKGTETFLCFSSPLDQNRGLIIAKRNRKSRKVEITAEGIACITHSNASRLHRHVENNVATGSTIIHQVHQAQVKPQNGNSNELQRFATLDEAMEYLAQLPRLRHLPYQRGNNCIFVRYGRGKQFVLIQAFDGSYVERGELFALHTNFFNIAVVLEELAVLDEIEREITQARSSKPLLNRKQMQDHRRKAIERLILMLTGDPIHLAKPEQPSLDFGIIKS